MAIGIERRKQERVRMSGALLFAALDPNRARRSRAVRSTAHATTTSTVIFAVQTRPAYVSYVVDLPTVPAQLCRRRESIRRRRREDRIVDVVDERIRYELGGDRR
jgi:hypothetical protein